MKEIVYNNLPNFFEIVEEGEYKGVRYICVNRGTHPCACVICDPLFLKKHAGSQGTLDCVNVHGGVTYSGEINGIDGLEGFKGDCFFWEYNKFDDWAGFWSDDENLKTNQRKWTTIEIVNDCRQAIDQYLDVMGKDNLLDPEESPMITKEVLKNMGFHSIFENMVDDNESAFEAQGIYDGNKWRIYVDLQTPSLSYARNQRSKRKYEGSILTMEELKMVIDLLDLPIKTDGSAMTNAID